MDIGHPTEGAKPSKDDKKKQTLMVAGTLVLIVIGYLTLKKMSAGSTASTGASTTGTGVTGTTSGGQGQDLTGLQYQLDTLSGMIANLNNAAPAVTLPGTDTNNPAPPTVTPTPAAPAAPAAGAKKTSNQATGPLMALVGAKRTPIGEILNRWVDSSGKAMSITAFRRLNPTLKTYDGGNKTVVGAHASTNDAVVKDEQINVTGYHLAGKAVPKPTTPATHG